VLPVVVLVDDASTGGCHILMYDDDVASGGAGAGGGADDQVGSADDQVQVVERDGLEQPNEFGLAVPRALARFTTRELSSESDSRVPTARATTNIHW
jgi:hypothetical protein